jgi:hypothetical protein
MAVKGVTFAFFTKITPLNGHLTPCLKHLVVFYELREIHVNNAASCAHLYSLAGGYDCLALLRRAGVRCAG